MAVSDQQSTTSSLTFYAKSLQNSGTRSTSTVPITNVPTKSIASASTVGTANTNTLQAALETRDTIAEKRAQLQRLTNMEIQRLQQREEQLMAELLQLEKLETQEESNDADTETRVKMVDKQVAQIIEPTNQSTRSPQSVPNKLSDMSNLNNKHTVVTQEESTSGHNTGQQK